MAKNLVSLWNMSLGIVGSRARLSGENDTRYEAEVVKKWYEPVRDTVFSAAHWSCLEGVKSLALIAERDFNLSWQESDPKHPWGFVYGLPTDFIYARYLDNYMPFSMSVRGQQRVLNTNLSTANLVYTTRQDNVALWTDDLYMGMAHAVAAAICQELNGKRQLAVNAQAYANNVIMTARINNANEDDTDYEHLPDWLIARGVGLSSQVSRYINPTGALLAVVSADAA